VGWLEESSCFLQTNQFRSGELSIMKLIIGGGSRIAHEFIRTNPLEQFHIVNRPTVERWLDGEATNELELFFSDLDDLPTEVLVLSGVTNPHSIPDVINSVNVRLPEKIIAVCADLSIPVSTFGSILETLGPTDNRYIESKLRLSEIVSGYHAAGAKVRHFRLHTVYGSGEPARHMFVGMMANSIQDRREFKMSSGEQLREYHHTEDLMNALRALSGAWLSPIVSVSNGNPITLRSLAESVFESFGVAHLLKIGAIDSPLNEVHSMLETRTLGLADVDFREPIIGVTEYLEELFTQTQEL